MSSARRTGSLGWFRRRIGLVLAVLLIGFAGQLRAGITERIVSNPYTGLAIDGYDPVAYFADNEARPGVVDYELSFGGVIWRFRNEGNQAAFAAHPDIYAPCFGGYDPGGVARGVTLPGHPLVFAITGDRLCLFFNEAERAKFLADPQRILRAADERWPDLSATLVQ